jgi:GIY-YIG catalytic domain
MEDGFISVEFMLHCGVYMLARRGVVVYVGQSKLLCRRVLEHWRKRGAKPAKRSYYGTSVYNGAVFDDVWIRPCMLGELDSIEAAMIKKYQPKYNVRGKDTVPRTEMPEEIRAMIAQLSALRPERPAELIMTIDRRGL